MSIESPGVLKSEHFISLDNIEVSTIERIPTKVINHSQQGTLNWQLLLEEVQILEFVNFKQSKL